MIDWMTDLVSSGKKYYKHRGAGVLVSGGFSLTLTRTLTLAPRNTYILLGIIARVRDLSGNQSLPRALAQVDDGLETDSWNAIHHALARKLVILVGVDTSRIVA